MKQLILTILFATAATPSYSQVECNPEPKEKEEYQQGPIQLKVNIDTLFIGKEKVSINETKLIYLNNQSPIIKFGDTLGIRFYHAQAIENYQVIHFMRIDLFLLNEGCWKKEHDFSYSQLYYYAGSHGAGAISVGALGDSDYFKIQWQFGIAKDE